MLGFVGVYVEALSVWSIFLRFWEIFPILRQRKGIEGNSSSYDTACFPNARLLLGKKLRPSKKEKMSFPRTQEPAAILAALPQMNTFPVVFCYRGPKQKRNESQRPFEARTCHSHCRGKAPKQPGWPQAWATWPKCLLPQMCWMMVKIT